MPHDLYSDGEPSSEKVSESGQTALLPKSFFPQGANPGDTITLRVTRVMDDQVEVANESYEEEDELDSGMPEIPASMAMPEAGPTGGMAGMFA